MKTFWIMYFLTITPNSDHVSWNRTTWESEYSCKVALEVMRNKFQPSEGKCIKLIQRNT